MKTLSIILAAIVSLIVVPQAAEKLPSDVQILVDQRAVAALKIENSFSQELEKLKVDYTKQGDLDMANGIASLIKGGAASANSKLPVQNAIDQRADAMAKINKIYVQELDKLKGAYTKKGDLETANSIVSLVKEAGAGGSDAPASEMAIVGKWSWSGGGTVEFQEDGNCKNQLGGIAKWKCLNKRTHTYENSWGNLMVMSPDATTLDVTTNGRNRFTARRLTSARDEQK